MKSKTEKISLRLLKYAFALIFIWFGVLKLISSSPALFMIEQALPFNLGKSSLVMLFIAVFEILIGVGLLFDRFLRLAAFLMMAHLLVATLSVLITQGFAPAFPALSLAGEFVIKNLALMAGGMIIFADAERGS